MCGYGLSEELKYVELILDSLDGESENTGYSKLDWPTFRISEDLKNVAAMKVLQAQIPFSYYVVDYNNQNFILQESGNAGSAIVTIPVGNYTGASLAPALASALTQASSTLTSKTYSVTYSSITGKYTFTSNAPAGQTFSFNFGGYGDTGSTNARLILGFTEGITTSNALTSPTLTAQNVAQISGPNYVYLCSESLGSLCSLYLPERRMGQYRGGQGPQIAQIPINCDPGQVAYYEDPDHDKWFDLENMYSLTSFDLFLMRGNQIDQFPLRLNGQSFSVKLGILLRKDTATRVISKNSQSGVKMIVG